MNDIQSTNSLATQSTQQIVWQTNPETQKMLTLGHQRGWDFMVLGQAPMPEEHVRLGGWLIVPAHQDTSPIPLRTQERVQAIFAAGLRPKGFVVVHEAPMLLQAPSQPPDTEPVHIPEFEPTSKTVGNALGAIGTVALAASGLAVISVAGIFLAGLLAIPAVLAAGAMAIDPMLIAVTEDDIWIEIDRWWN
jgi:hypothetical protein